MTIDSALRLNPDGFDALMQLLEEIGCRIKYGAHISVSACYAFLCRAKRVMQLHAILNAPLAL